MLLCFFILLVMTWQTLCLGSVIAKKYKYSFTKQCTHDLLKIEIVCLPRVLVTTANALSYVAEDGTFDHRDERIYDQRLVNHQDEVIPLKFEVYKYTVTDAVRSIMLAEEVLDIAWCR
jgi:hypothetical protein